MPPASNVKMVPLGKNGPMVPQLGLGLMGLTYMVYGDVASDEERFAFLDRAWEIGARFWDTADLYGDGEELIGKWFKRTGKRDDIFLASKFGFVKGSKTMEVNTTGKYAKEACGESMRLLGVESIDLYYIHHTNHDTPIEETMRAMKELQAEGKIKHIGLSAVSSASILRAVKIAPVAAVQLDYSPFVLDIETSKGYNVLSTCRSLSIPVVAATPLGRGLLTSTFASKQPLAPGSKFDVRSTMMPRFQPTAITTNAAAVQKLQVFADKLECSVTQLALAWLMKQGDDVIPIPGTKKIKYLEENWGAFGVAERMTGEMEGEIRAFLEGVKLEGGALPKEFESWALSDTVEEK